MSLGPEARARLRARYVAGLHDRLEAMLALQARLGAGDPTAPAEARRLGHQLAGTGASFGIPELSDRGRELELAEDGWLAQALERLIDTTVATLQREG